MYQRGLADKASARFPVCVSPPVSPHPLTNLNTVISGCLKNSNTFCAAYASQIQVCEGEKQDSADMAAWNMQLIVVDNISILNVFKTIAKMLFQTLQIILTLFLVSTTTLND